MRATSLLLLLSLSLAGVTTARGLDPGKRLTQLAVDRWGEKEGLPSLGIFAVALSADGYLWLGTDDGLVRFDGARFTPLNARNTPALPRGPVFALAAAADGRLWMGAGDGSVLALEGRRIERLVGTDSEGEDGVMALLVDRGGHLWVWRELSGLARYRIADAGLEDAGLPQALAEAELPHQQIPRRSIVEDAEGRLWLASQGGGLLVLDGDGLTRITTADGLSDDFVHTVAEDPMGGVWVGTHGGLDHYRDGEVTAMTSAVGLVGGGVVALHVDPAGSLWINQRGLFRRVSGDGGRLELLSGTDEIRGELCLAEDAEGGLWIGALGAGLLYARDDGFTPLGPPEGFPDSVVLSLREEAAGRLWIGTSRAGVIVLEDGAMIPISTADGLPHRLVWSMAPGRDGETWLGTNGGLARRRLDGEIEVFTAADGLPGDRVRVVHRDPEKPGTLWLGTIDGGVSRFREGALSNLTTADGLGHDNVRWLQTDRDGGLWIGLQNGLQRLRAASGLEQLRAGELDTFTRADGLASTRMRSAYLDGQGTLWVGTLGGGLSRFRDGRFVSYTRDDGLPFDDVWGILDDGGGNFWLSGHGVSRIAIQDFDDYDAGRTERLRPEAMDSPGFDRVECCVAGGNPGLWRGADGRLWKGVVAVDPRALEDRHRLPPPIVESIVADGAALDVGTEAVPPGVGDLQIAYTSPRLSAAGRLSFRYRLAGLDEQWTDAGARRIAYYSHLPPGRYQFQVAASAEPGWWRQPAATVPLRVLPFWWQTLWFRVAAVLAAAGLGLAWHRARIRRIEARSQRLRREVGERLRAEAALLAEVEERERAEASLREHRAQLAHAGRVTTMGELAAALAHELNQPLTAIGTNARAAQRFLAAAEPDLEEVGEILGDVVADNRRAAEIIRRLRSMMKKDALQLERLDVNHAVDEAVALLESEAVLRGVNLETRLDLELPAVEADRVHLWQVLVNLIRNAIEAMADTPPAERRVLVLTEREGGGGVRVSVRDSGPGFDQSEAEALFAPFHTTKAEGLGMGLAIARTIVEAHGGRISARKNQDRGATFEFCLPAAPTPQA